MEIPFITGTMKLLGIERFMFNNENLPDAIRLSIAMQSYWAEFAYNGSPGKGEITLCLRGILGLLLEIK